MKLKKKTIQELGDILERQFEMKLSENELEKLAYSLVGYFDLLFTGYARGKVRK